MIFKIIRNLCLPFICIFALLMIFLNAPTECYGFEIDIDVAPNVLNILSQGEVVTVHTNIGYSLVDVESVYLNDVPIDHSKVDNRGYFVAKFLMDAIKNLDGLIIGDYNTLKLVGATTEGEAFLGQQEIMVIENIPAGGAQ